jgi:hypothetical protein
MEVFVRGSRSSTQDWLRAQQIPANELPSLDEEQKAEARLTHRSEEDYARSVYAGQLSQQSMLQKLLRFGHWLAAKIEERSPESGIDSIELNTWSGKLQIQGMTGGEPFLFDLDEEMVERFLTTGAGELESSILRVLDIFLPQRKVARAS